MTDLNAPLSEDELDQLSDFLDTLPSPTAMNIERLDGFFCALIAGPELVLPGEYWPKVIGTQTDEARPSFETLEQAQQIMNLLTRHWNTIAGTLRAGDIYLPILLLDDSNLSRGNNWAKGFLDGLDMRRSLWQLLLHSEEDGGLLIPMFALAHEDDPDPELRFNTPTPEKREELLHLMTAYLVKIYRFFEQDRVIAPLLAPRPIARSTPKIGRNDPCYCGSGRKYKRCCMTTVH